MGAKMMYTPLESVFKATMEREGAVCTTYTGGTEFQCFFRIRDNGENQKETTTIYYDVTAPIRPGTLICYGYGIFMALNRETVENDVYYKSTLIKCNGVYNENKRVVENIPIYSGNVQSSVSVGNSIITMLDGNVELLTEENSLSQKIEINQTFNEFGRTFKVSNIYSMDGILHIIAEVTQNITPTYDYSLIIDDIPTDYCKTGDTVQLSATAYVNDSITTGATIEWTSSNNTIATVDGVGLINCISEGTVDITATWIEHNVKQSTILVISNSEDIPNYTCSISGGTILRYGMARTWNVTFTNETGDDITHLMTYNWRVVGDYKISQSISGNKITIKYDEDNYMGETFLLQIVVDNTIIKQMEIIMTSSL